MVRLTKPAENFSQGRYSPGRNLKPGTPEFNSDVNIILPSPPPPPQPCRSLPHTSIPSLQVKYPALHATCALLCYSVRHKRCSPMTSHLAKLTEEVRQEMWRRNKDWWRGSGWVGIGSNEVCKSEGRWRLSGLVYAVYSDICLKRTLLNCSIANQIKTK